MTRSLASSNMKILTVNVKEEHVSFINRLIGEDGIYPSRSELVRFAVRLKLEKSREFIEKEPKVLVPDGYVQIPGMEGFTKIVRRLDF